MFPPGKVDRVELPAPFGREVHVFSREPGPCSEMIKSFAKGPSLKDSSGTQRTEQGDQNPMSFKFQVSTSSHLRGEHCPFTLQSQSLGSGAELAP